MLPALGYIVDMTKTQILEALRNHGEKARLSGSGIHVPQFGRMTMRQARDLLATHEDDERDWERRDLESRMG